MGVTDGDRSPNRSGAPPYLVPGRDVPLLPGHRKGDRFYIPHHPFGRTRAQFSYRQNELDALPGMIAADATAAETFHAACLVGFVALRLEVATVDEVLGDFGLVHELAHQREFGLDVGGSALTVDELVRLAEHLVERIRDAHRGADG